MFVQLLTARQSGLDPHWTWPKLYQQLRYAELEVCEGKEFARVQRSGITSLDIDRQEGRYVISGSRDKNGCIVIHDVSPGATVVTEEVGGVPKAPVVCKVLSSSSATSTSLASSSSSLSSSSSSSSSHAVSKVQWYPHDTGMFTSTCADNTLKIWDTNELAVVETFKFQKMVYTHAMANAHSHTLIAVGGQDCKVTLCDMESGSSSHILRFHSNSILSLAWSPYSEHMLASGDEGGAILLWDVRRATGPVACLDQHNGSGRSAAAGVTAHEKGVNGLSFTSDGLYLVSYGADNALRLWDTFTAKNTLMNYGRLTNPGASQNIQLYVTPHTLSMSPLALVPCAAELRLLDLTAGKTVKRLRGHFGDVFCVTGHPREQMFFSGGNDRTMLMWAPAARQADDSTQRRGHGTQSRVVSTQRGGVYDDAWSDED